MVIQTSLARLKSSQSMQDPAIVGTSRMVRESCGGLSRGDRQAQGPSDRRSVILEHRLDRREVTYGHRRWTMSFAQRVREALDRQGVPHGTADREGYRVEVAPDDLIIVRWGYAAPFNGLSSHQDGDGLEACAVALKRERFLVAPNPFEDADGHFIAVRESSL